MDADRLTPHPGGCNGPGCRLCYLARHDRRYRDLWGVTGWGDRAAWVARRTGAAWLVGRLERLTGRPCGCGARRDAMNRWPTPAELWRRLRG